MKINEFSKLTGKLSVVHRYYRASDLLSATYVKLQDKGDNRRNHNNSQNYTLLNEM